MTELHLHKIHESLGADFAETEGRLMPESYGDASGEYEAVRNSAGIIDLSHRGKLRLSGKEHIKFLQGMLTNDVMKLASREGMYAAVLTVKGRMLSDMRVYKEDESVLLDLEPGLNEKVKELLLKYRLSYKAAIEDETDAFALISVQGPRSSALVESAAGSALPELKEYAHFKTVIKGVGVTIVRISRTGEDGYDIYVPAADAHTVWEELFDRGKDFGARPFGSRALDMLRIEAGIPVYGKDMDEDTIPIEAGIWDALSFEKGCYIGQEVVARIKWRGHVNRHLMGIVPEGEGVIGVGDEIFSGDKKIGAVTSVSYSPALGRDTALGYVRREHREPGTAVLLKDRDGRMRQAAVSGLPFLPGKAVSQTN